MKNPINIVRNAGVAEVSEVQATGGTTGEVAKVGPRKPTAEDASNLGMYWQQGLKLKRAMTKATTDLLATLGPITTSEEDRADTILKYSEQAGSFAEEINGLIQKIHALPAGTTPKGWVGPCARASAVASIAGAIGGDLARVITPAGATKALGIVYKS